jgi:hypothetical protein
MGRIILANHLGDVHFDWDPDSTSEEGRAAVKTAERILAEARANGCAVSKKLAGSHVLDREPFDPRVEEYQILAPIVGG